MVWLTLKYLIKIEVKMCKIFSLGKKMLHVVMIMTI